MPRVANLTHEEEPLGEVRKNGKAVVLGNLSLFQPVTIGENVVKDYWGLADDLEARQHAVEACMRGLTRALTGTRSISAFYQEVDLGRYQEMLKRGETATMHAPLHASVLEEV